MEGSKPTRRSCHPSPTIKLIVHRKSESHFSRYNQWALFSLGCIVPGWNIKMFFSLTYYYCFPLTFHSLFHDFIASKFSFFLQIRILRRAYSDLPITHNKNRLNKENNTWEKPPLYTYSDRSCLFKELKYLKVYCAGQETVTGLLILPCCLEFWQIYIFQL